MQALQIFIALSAHAVSYSAEPARSFPSLVMEGKRAESIHANRSTIVGKNTVAKSTVAKTTLYFYTAPGCPPNEYTP